MKKIIAKELPPEAVDFEFYFDNDGFKSAGGENCAIYIPPISRRHLGYNTEEFDGIVSLAENIVEEFDILGRLSSGFNSYKEIMEFYGISYNPKKCHELKMWAEDANTGSAYVIADFLSIIRGKEYSAKSFTGYCQGEYCIVIYCDEMYSPESVEEIGKMWLGCGTEFSFSEDDGDEVLGYYVTDTVRWTEDDRLVNKLAEMYGCKPEELRVDIWEKGKYKTITEEEPENISETEEKYIATLSNGEIIDLKRTAIAIACGIAEDCSLNPGSTSRIAIEELKKILKIKEIRSNL